MRNAVSVPVSEYSVRTDDQASLESFVNKELRPVLTQLRTGVNALNPEKPRPVDSDGAGTYAILWTSSVMPQDCVWLLNAYVCGSGGANRSTYLMVTSIESVAGVVAPLGVTTVLHSAETVAGCDARFAYDPVERLVAVEACDDAATAMRWTATVTTSEGMSEQ